MLRVLAAGTGGIRSGVSVIGWWGGRRVSVLPGEEPGGAEERSPQLGGSQDAHDLAAAKRAFKVPARKVDPVESAGLPLVSSRPLATSVSLARRSVRLVGPTSRALAAAAPSRPSLPVLSAPNANHREKVDRTRRRTAHHRRGGPRPSCARPRGRTRGGTSAAAAARGWGRSARRGTLRGWTRWASGRGRAWGRGAVRGVRGG